MQPYIIRRPPMAEAPRHWSERYVGMPYVVDQFECADLCVLVNREVFRREIRLPAIRWHRGKRGHERYQAMTDQVAAAKDDYAEPTSAPEEGDAVLLLSRGRMSHIGTYCVIQGEPWVLHAVSWAGQALLTRIRELHLQGLQVEGYYRWT